MRQADGNGQLLVLSLREGPRPKCHEGSRVSGRHTRGPPPSTRTGASVARHAGRTPPVPGSGRRRPAHPPSRGARGSRPTAPRLDKSPCPTKVQLVHQTPVLFREQTVARRGDKGFVELQVDLVISFEVPRSGEAIHLVQRLAQPVQHRIGDPVGQEAPCRPEDGGRQIVDFKSLQWGDGADMHPTVCSQHDKASSLKASQSFSN